MSEQVSGVTEGPCPPLCRVTWGQSRREATRALHGSRSADGVRSERGLAGCRQQSRGGR